MVYLWFYQLQLVNKTNIKWSEYILKFFRRSVASGGGLYPGEIYLYVESIKGIKSGLYYFDVRGPRLILLREGNFQEFIKKSLQYNQDRNVYIFITSFYWKNFFKYLNFSYRLQGLDIGAIVSQAHLISKKLGLNSEIRYHFDDKKINDFLGINAEEESSYVVLPIDMDNNSYKSENKVPAFEYFKNDTTFNYIEHLNVGPKNVCQDIYKINSNIINSGLIKVKKNEIASFKEEANVVHKEKYDYDILKASVSRISPGENFLSDFLNIQHVHKVLDVGMQEQFKNDIFSDNYSVLKDVEIYFYANKIEGLPKGYYYYNPSNKSFVLKHKGDFSSVFQENLTRKNFNLVEMPLIVHLVLNMKKFIENMKFRGYRVMQMEAGRIMHQIQLNAAGLNLGSHPMLGYRADNLEEFFGIQNNITVQMSIGKYRPLLRLTNNLLNKTKGEQFYV
ncbi:MULTISPECIES: SagB family peptide dehydrogenase [unclassified Bacillus (in: firmicutes)]|uniref:SagB family peptide dehydrogenase n=1 Tax=unclassified Bacillus (in: firmicutes) TaxID=185979 RepID=UPI0030FA6BBD